MDESIMVALITLAGVIVTAAVQSKSLTSAFSEQSKLADAEMDKKISVYAAATDAKIDELSREVKAHNNFAQKVPLLEQKIERVEKDIAMLQVHS